MQGTSGGRVAKGGGVAENGIVRLAQDPPVKKDSALPIAALLPDPRVHQRRVKMLHVVRRQRLPHARTR